MDTEVLVQTSSKAFVRPATFISEIAPHESSKFVIAERHKRKKVVFAYFDSDVDIVKSKDPEHVTCKACRETVNVLDPLHPVACWSIDRWLSHKTLCTAMQ